MVLETIPEENFIRPCKCQIELTQEDCREYPFCTVCYSFYNYKYCTIQGTMFFFLSNLVDVYLIYLFFTTNNNNLESALNYYFLYLLFEMSLVGNGFQKVYKNYKRVSEYNIFDVFFTMLLFIQEINLVILTKYILFSKLFVWNNVTVHVNKIINSGVAYIIIKFIDSIKFIIYSGLLILFSQLFNYTIFDKKITVHLIVNKLSIFIFFIFAILYTF
jgi:hypothetical protein